MTDIDKLKAAAEAYVQIQEKANTIHSQRGNSLEYWDAEKQIDDYGDVFRAEANPTTILSLIADSEFVSAVEADNAKLREALRITKRTAELSASVTRETERTKATGKVAEMCERIARQFDRLADTARAALEGKGKP